MPEFEFTSRYDVFGPPNGCKGQCEGTGFIPIHRQEKDPLLKKLWDILESKNAAEDDYHFVPCPDCRPTDPLVVEAKAAVGA